MTDRPHTPYPLLLAPIFKEKVWGGRALEALGKCLPPGAQIGESWELADLDSTSASGGDGESARSIIENGPLRARSLRDALQLWGADLLGRVRPTPEGGFPLLVKFLDARENLSVQVHPSPAYARANTGAHLKTESWCVLSAEPGAVIFKGVRPGVSPESFARRIADGSCADDLVRIPVRAGDFHHLPSGTVHALGAGVVVAEVQTPSDTTFRVFDWGRSGRELHVAQALACIDFTPASEPEAHAPPLRNGERRPLVRTPFYAIERWSLRAPAALPVSGAPVVVMTLDGAGAVTSPSRAFADVSLERGRTCLVPAASADASLAPRPVGLDALVVTFPG